MNDLDIRKKTKYVGLVDADLMDGGTRHPNLVLLKIAGFLFDNHIPFKLIFETDIDIDEFSHIYLSRVFTFTSLPKFYTDVIGTVKEKKFHVGGTGFYADISNVKEYSSKRLDDFYALEKDTYLSSLRNHRGGQNEYGINMARQMPFYKLYDDYIDVQIQRGSKIEKFKDYRKFSIGFLTRGCVRHCPFCINKLENKVLPYSKLEWFLDDERDEKGKLLRPYIYLWDDNFLASDPRIWRPLLQALIDSKRPFQFRQGLDERMLAQSPYGEEMAQMLSHSTYYGDFIFAFDNWKDRDLIIRALKIWKKANPKKGTKFYLFCGFKLTEKDHDKFYKDVWELFHRIKILMSFGCVGYVMRHEDYHNYDLSNLYVQIARWCNQPAFFKKMSFWEFVYRNQSYWEEKHLKLTDKPKLKSYDDFMIELQNGYYGTDPGQVKLTLPIRTVLDTLDRFPQHKNELLEMFNYKMTNLLDPKNWE